MMVVTAVTVVAPTRATTNGQRGAAVVTLHAGGLTRDAEGHLAGGYGRSRDPLIDHTVR